MKYQCHMESEVCWTHLHFVYTCKKTAFCRILLYIIIMMMVRLCSLSLLWWIEMILIFSGMEYNAKRKLLIRCSYWFKRLCAALIGLIIEKSQPNVAKIGESRVAIDMHRMCDSIIWHQNVSKLLLKSVHSNCYCVN